MTRKAKYTISVIISATIGITGNYCNVSANENRITVAEDDFVITPTERGLYAMAGVITEIDCEAVEGFDALTIESGNGNIWTYYSDAKDWGTGDIIVCTMDNKGTVSVKDDEIVSASYSGTAEQFYELINK